MWALHKKKKKYSVHYGQAACIKESMIVTIGNILHLKGYSHAICFKLLTIIFISNCPVKEYHKKENSHL